MRVWLCKQIWLTGEILQWMMLAIVVLVPKGTNGNFRSIYLLEFIWKFLERVFDAWFPEIILHDYLNGFRVKRGCATGIMEAKRHQKLAFREQIPMCCIFLDLQKTLDAMDRERCLEILEDAGV